MPVRKKRKKKKKKTERLKGFKFHAFIGLSNDIMEVKGLMQESFWWWQCTDRYIISLFPPPPYPLPTFSTALTSLMVSVDVNYHVYLLLPPEWFMH